MNDYVAAIRQALAPGRRDQAPDGSCEARRQVRRALDAYLPVVVDAIEEATGEVIGRPPPEALQAAEARS